MTKKDFEAIALAIKANLDTVNNADFFFDFLSDLCKAFKKSNPRFDSIKFRKACLDMDWRKEFNERF
jgi:hypothetical protein